MTDARTVLVTDGDQRAALATVRSLGAAGYRCIVLSRAPRRIAGVSRHASRELIVPDALEQPGAFVDAVAEVAENEEAALLVPITEASLLALLPARARFGRCVIPFPDADAFREISDKERVLREAIALGIAVPQQLVVADAAAAAELAADAVQYPVVVKPSRSVGEAAGVRVKLGVSHVSDAAALRRVLGGLPPAAFPVLIQQRIDGEGVGIFLLVWSGQLVAMFAHRRLAEKPPSGGVSVYCESVTADPDLVTRSRALLDRFGWQGAAMVEYKRDASTGTPYLMEVNGRFWGSLQLAIDAGADFPSLLAALALGDSVPARGAYRVGVRSRWWWGQVDHLLARARGKHSPLAPGTVSFARAAADAVLGPFRSRDRDGVFRFDDPRPFVRESILWILGE